MAIVYQATNLIKGMRYVGATKRSLANRRSSHHSAAKEGKPTRFAAALRKYGRASFRWETLSEWGTYDEALTEEARLIALMNPEYNAIDGDGFWKPWPADLAPGLLKRPLDTGGLRHRS